MTQAMLSVSWQEVESKAIWNCWRSCWQMRVHVRVHARHEEKELQYVTIITSSLNLWLISPDSGPLRYQSGVRFFVSKNSGTVATCTDSKPTHVIQSFRQIILELYFRNKWGYLFSTWCWVLFGFFQMSHRTCWLGNSKPPGLFLWWFCWCCTRRRFVQASLCLCKSSTCSGQKA